MKSIVEAAGLTMEHVVYVRVYLTDHADEGPLNQGWKEFFPKSPTRFTIGVASLRGTPVEMTAVAVKDLPSSGIVESHWLADGGWAPKC